MLTKIVSSFEGENMQKKCNVLSYKINLYFHGYKLAIEIDLNGHSDRNILRRNKNTKSNRARPWFEVYKN